MPSTSVREKLREYFNPLAWKEARLTKHSIFKDFDEYFIDDVQERFGTEKTFKKPAFSDIPYLKTLFRVRPGGREAKWKVYSYFENSDIPLRENQKKQIENVMAELARKYPRHETLEIYRMLKERKEGEKIVMVGRLMTREKSNLPRMWRCSSVYILKQTI